MNLPIVKSYSYETSVASINFLPNPVGIGQEVLILVFLQPNPPTGYSYHNLQMTIQEPDGFMRNITTNSDGLGVAGFTFTPCLLGIHNIIFTYPGETLANDEYRRCDYSTSFNTIIMSGGIPPVASFTYLPNDPKVGDSIEFNAESSYDPDGEIINYSWDFGDQTKGINMKPNHTYEEAGTYIVKLRVSDNDSICGTDSSQVTVRVQDALMKNQFKLTVMCNGNGTINPIEGSHMYDDGFNVPVEASPEEGWRFDHWILDDTDFGSDNPISVSMDDNHILRAVFVETNQVGTSYPFWIFAIGIGIPAFGIVILLIKRRKQKKDIEMSEPKKLITILFLAANPAGTSQLDLTEEVNAIDDELYKSKFRERFNLEQRFELKPDEISEQLLRHNPQIVHFSGHGSKAGEIILEDETGKIHPVGVLAISKLFSTLKDNIRCVVLNACYSEDQAILIARHVDCVIGMSKAIGDEAAIKFARGFYRGIGYGRDIGNAFQMGCNQIDLEGIAEKDTPKIIWKNGKPQKIVLTEH